MSALALLVGLAGSREALALQGGEDASTLPVLIEKKNGLAGRLQLSAMFSTALATKYTESTGGTLNVQYNFIDQLGLELVGGFYGSGEAQILEEIRAQLGGNDPMVSDMHQMQWVVGLNAVWIPIYGKISFISEWNPSFDLYILAGGGVIGTRRGVDANRDAVVDTSDSEIAPQFNFGGGLRVFLNTDWAVRLDVRNYFYADPDGGEMTASGPDAMDPNDNGEISGMTQALVGQVGIQYTFGGN